MLLHGDSDGWIALAKKETDDSFQQRHFKVTDIDGIALKLTEWLPHNVYFSQNTFYKPRRKIENVRQLRAIYVDVDCYNLGYSPEWVLGKLDLETFKQTLPDPNLVINSGRGLVFIWRIEPAPYKALRLWTAIQSFFFKQLLHVGADPKSLDAARVFRVDGSINTKNGNAVAIHNRHNYVYELRELQEEYLPELESPKQAKNQGKTPSKIVFVHRVRQLYHARLSDLQRLVELRDYDVYGYRELLCFIYRHFMCCYTNNPDDALKRTLEFNSSFTAPLSDNEVIKSTKSAEEAWSNKFNDDLNAAAIEQGYPAIGYNFTNKRLIEILKITQKEQQHLQTIIGESEKKRRDRLYQEKKRREQGVVRREEYLKQQEKVTQGHLNKLKQILKDNPSAKRKDIAEKLGVSGPRVTQLKKLLFENEKK